jgi:hypothetical protein
MPSSRALGTEAAIVDVVREALGSRAAVGRVAWYVRHGGAAACTPRFLDTMLELLDTRAASFDGIQAARLTHEDLNPYAETARIDLGYPQRTVRSWASRRFA